MKLGGGGGFGIDPYSINNIHHQINIVTIFNIFMKPWSNLAKKQTKFGKGGKKRCYVSPIERGGFVGLVGKGGVKKAESVKWQKIK